LARDQEEARQVAVQHAQSKGPEHVYDDVFLPALTFARRDRKHRGLNAEDERVIFETTRDILGHVDFESSRATAGLQPKGTVDHPPSQSDKKPDEPRPTVLVLGWPAHHEAEELSLVMLDRLLRQDAYQLEVLSTRILPAEVVDKVEREKPALLFIAILP